jgi:hypothetical protein
MDVAVEGLTRRRLPREPSLIDPMWKVWAKAHNVTAPGTQVIGQPYDPGLAAVRATGSVRPSGRAPRVATNARRRGSRRASVSHGPPSDDDPGEPEPPDAGGSLALLRSPLDGPTPRFSRPWRPRTEARFRARIRAVAHDQLVFKELA